MKRKLILITQDFPYGNAETSFLLPEVKVLKDYFDLHIIATQLEGVERCNDNMGFDVKEISMRATVFQKLQAALFLMFHAEIWDEMKDILKDRVHIIQRFKRSFMYGIYAEIFWSRMRKTINMSKDTEGIFYFYWWDYKCLALTMHRKKYPNIRIITRTHNYDLYDERECGGRQCYKNQMDYKLDRIFFIADYGRHYYLEKQQKTESAKYILSRLGVPEQMQKVKPAKDEFVLLSCSWMAPIKRIELIIDGLSLIKSSKRIRWIHIGDGSERMNLIGRAQRKLSGRENIKYEFTGALTNREVILYYRQHMVNCFITTTALEGNPVSVQEALSFGMPIIGTAVSDIPLMIENNGVLLSENPTAEEVAEAIQKMMALDEIQWEKMAQESVKIWRRDYDASQNFAEFMKALQRV